MLTCVSVTAALFRADAMALRLLPLTPVTPASLNVCRLRLSVLFSFAAFWIAASAVATLLSTVEGVVEGPFTVLATVFFRLSLPAAFLFSVAVPAPATRRDWVSVFIVPRLPVVSMPAATVLMALLVPLVLPTPDSAASTAPYFSAALAPSSVL